MSGRSGYPREQAAASMRVDSAHAPGARAESAGLPEPSREGAVGHEALEAGQGAGDRSRSARLPVEFPRLGRPRGTDRAGHFSQPSSTSTRRRFWVLSGGEERRLRDLKKRRAPKNPTKIKRRETTRRAWVRKRAGLACNAVAGERPLVEELASALEAERPSDSRLGEARRELRALTAVAWCADRPGGAWCAAGR